MIEWLPIWLIGAPTVLVIVDVAITPKARPEAGAKKEAPKGLKDAAEAVSG